MNGQKFGGCVCGNIRYQISGEPLRVTVCHCTWCQRRTETAFGIESVFNIAQVIFLGGTPTKYRHISDVSGRWLDVEFCPQCGSNIGLTLELVQDIRSIAAGTLDNPSWINAGKFPFRHVFTRSHRNWSLIPNDVEIYEEHFRV